METFDYFVFIHFGYSLDYDELDDQIDFFEIRKPEFKNDLLVELEAVMESGNYEIARKILKEAGRILSKRATEEFIRYLYYRLKGKKPRLTLEQLMEIR
jgi:ribosomal protein S7